MSSQARERRFPPGFLWGAATSAYQIEGGATEDGRGPSIWDTFSATPGAVIGGDTGAEAADHVHQYRQDVALMADLGLQMYRFSVAWPRIQPDGRGAINQQGLDFYRRLLDELEAHDILPNLTLYHWDLPQPLQDAGGWATRDTALRFADFAELVFREFHDRVGWWSTINEPWCVTLLGYAAGVHAPGIQDPRQAIRAVHHVLLGHGLAVQRMRAIDAGPRHAIVLNVAPVHAGPGQSGPHLDVAVRLTDGYRNRIWLDPLFRGGYPQDMAAHVARYGGFPIEDGDMAAIGTPLDWLGINYYNDTYLAMDDGRGESGGLALVHPGVVGVREARIPGERTDLDWPITPDGLRELLVSIARDYPAAPPMLITENGAAYDDPIGSDGAIHDDRRVRYMAAHVNAVADAIAAGVDMRGYMAWSLLDNFEWAEGYSQRFGIIHVDYQTQVRTLRESAAWYRAAIARHGDAEPTPSAAS